MTAQMAAAGEIVGHGTRTSADRSNAAPKWTIVGVANAAPASGARSDGLSAMSVTTNYKPINAPVRIEADHKSHSLLMRVRPCRLHDGSIERIALSFFDVDSIGDQ